LWCRTPKAVVGQVQDLKVSQLANRRRNLTCQFTIGRKNKGYQVLLFENRTWDCTMQVVIAQIKVYQGIVLEFTYITYEIIVMKVKIL
jgi:hypothetical protein